MTASNTSGHVAPPKVLYQDLAGKNAIVTYEFPTLNRGYSFQLG